MTQDEIILTPQDKFTTKGKIYQSISKAYRQYGVSRTVYYKYLDRYITYGIEGLKDKEKSAPVTPNATKANVVDKVLGIARKYPTYGPLKACK